MFIPDFLLVTGIILGLIFSVHNGLILDSLKGLSFGFLFMYLVGSIARSALKKEALGEGDIKLAIMLGSFLGLERTALSIFIASFSGALIGIVLILLGRMSRKDYIPFGPFLALGAVVSILI